MVTDVGGTATAMGVLVKSQGDSGGEDDDGDDDDDATGKWRL